MLEGTELCYSEYYVLFNNHVNILYSRAGLLSFHVFVKSHYDMYFLCSFTLLMT